MHQPNLILGRLIEPASGAATSPFDAIRHIDDGGEFWWARELLMGTPTTPGLGYCKWQNAEQAIRRAIKACRNSGQQPAEHVTDVSKLFPKGNGALQTGNDYRLSRYACYLVAMNGDPDKPEVAAAMAYFAIQTRRAETPTPAIHRGLSARMSKFLEAHRLHLCINCGPGYWTIFSAMEVPALMIEDELVRHRLPVLESDRLDNSLAGLWPEFRRGKPWAMPTKKGRLELEQQRIMIEPTAYHPAEYPYFQHWFYMTYQPEKLPGYLGRKFPQKHFGLAGYSAANNACLRTSGQPAKLPSRASKQIAAAGGFIPAPEVPLIA